MTEQRIRGHDGQVIREAHYPGHVSVSGGVVLLACVVEGDLIAEDAAPRFIACYAEGEIRHPDATRLRGCASGAELVRRDNTLRPRDT